MGYLGRDVEIVELNNNQCLVIACDSCGAIGEKEIDVVKVPNEMVGGFTARVALMEVLAVGASPISLTVTISNEGEPTGEKLLDGVRSQLTSLDLPSIPIVISTEKNMITRQTGLGITVIGLSSLANLRIAKSRSGDGVYCLGIPKVGQEVTSLEDKEIINYWSIQELLKYSEINELVPVGSKGIRNEALQLASGVNCSLETYPNLPIDIFKSGGPSTSLIFTCSSDDILQKLDLGSIPLVKIGFLK